MKEPGPVICRRKSASSLAQEGKPGPKCGRCGAAVVARSDLLGWLDDAPLCGDCLLKEAPSLGWAFRLVETGALVIAGPWPRTARSSDLPALLQLLEAIRAGVGPVQEENRAVPFVVQVLHLIGRRGGAGHLLLRILDLARVLDVGARYAARRQSVSAQLDALKEHLAAVIHRQGSDIELPEDPDIGRVLEILEQLDVDPSAFFAELWPLSALDQDEDR